MSKNKLFKLIISVCFLAVLPLRSDYFELSEQSFNAISSSDLIQLNCKKCTVHPVEGVCDDLKRRTYGYRDKVEIPQIAALFEPDYKCVVLFKNRSISLDETCESTSYYHACESELDVNILADLGRKNLLYPDGSITEMWIPEDLTIFLVKNAHKYSFLPGAYFKMQASDWKFYPKSEVKRPAKP